MIQSGRDPLAHFAAMLAEADFTVGNLECPIATTGQPLESKIFSFRAHPRVLSILKGRFNALASPTTTPATTARKPFSRP